MVKQKKHLGKGAVVSSLLCYLHPSQHIRDKFINIGKGQRLNELKVLRKEVKTIRRKEVMCIVMQHNDFKGIELYCIERWCRIVTEGPPDYFFDAPAEEIAPTNADDCETKRELESEVQAAVNRLADKINLVEIEPLVDVDNDNDPVAENLPTAPSTGNLVMEEEWGHNGICHRRKAAVTNMQARVLFPSELSPTALQVFEFFFSRTTYSKRFCQ